MEKIQKDHLAIQEAEIKRVGLILKTLDHDLRQQILNLIHQEKATSVTTIYTTFGLVQSVASRHLSKLRRAGIARMHREGKSVYYTVDYATLNKVQYIVNGFLQK